MATVATVLAEACARPEHTMRMTWYLRNKKKYVGADKEIGAAYREVIGAHHPAMTAVQVAGLLGQRARGDIGTSLMRCLAGCVTSKR